jgi:enoyl-[acyl-carrier-protein] reductase (NADH)
MYHILKKLEFWFLFLYQPAGPFRPARMNPGASVLTLSYFAAEKAFSGCDRGMSFSQSSP